jgi:hypothetical protein
MKKIFSFLPLVFFISIIVLLQSCKKDEDPVTPPIERPVYEGSGTVGSGGAIVQITTQSSPINGAYVDIPEGAISSNTTITIRQAPANIKAPTDTTAIVIQFEPKGLQFNSEVKIGLPYNPTNQDPSKLKAFYYDPDSAIVKELIIESFDTDKKIVIAYTNHFSKFYASNSNVGAQVEMFKINGKFAAKVRIFGDYSGNLTNTIFGIPTILPVSILYPNMGNALQNYVGFNAIVGIRVILAEQVLGSVAMEKSRCNLYFQRWDFGAPAQQVDIYKYDIFNGTSQFLYNYPPDGSSRFWEVTDIDTWYSGKTLIFRFDDFTPNPNKNYWFSVYFAMSNEPALTMFGRITQFYGLNNPKFVNREFY